LVWNLKGHVTIRISHTGTQNSVVSGVFFGSAAPSGPSINGPTALPSGTVGVAYSVTTLGAAGGAAPYTWSAAGLPAGLTINPATGAISGTPSAATGSPFGVTVTVTDSSSICSFRNYSLSIALGTAAASATFLKV